MSSKPTLSQINDRFNQLVLAKEDPVGQDYWQTPSETIMHLTGDCEDYAIVKLYTLLHFGYSETDVSIYAVRLKAEYHGGKTGGVINHAFTVYQGWVLDNLNRHIVRFSDRIDVRETYGIIQPGQLSPYKQWHDMLARRIPNLEAQLITNLFEKR